MFNNLRGLNDIRKAIKTLWRRINQVEANGGAGVPGPQGPPGPAGADGADGTDILPLNNEFTGNNTFSGDTIKLLTNAAAQFGAKVYLFKAETNTSGFLATQYAGIDRNSGTGTHWADVIIMNDNSADANGSGGTETALVMWDGTNWIYH